MTANPLATAHHTYWIRFHAGPRCPLASQALGYNASKVCLSAPLSGGDADLTDPRSHRHPWGITSISRRCRQTTGEHRAPGLCSFILIHDWLWSVVPSTKHTCTTLIAAHIPLPWCTWHLTCLSWDTCDTYLMAFPARQGCYHACSALIEV